MEEGLEAEGQNCEILRATRKPHDSPSSHPQPLNHGYFSYPSGPRRTNLLPCERVKYPGFDLTRPSRTDGMASRQAFWLFGRFSPIFSLRSSLFRSVLYYPG